MGLAHVALKIGDSLESCGRPRRCWRRTRLKIRGLRDHHVSQSIYLEDPDGNTIELFVDADPAIWSEDPTTVAVPRSP